MKTERNIPKTDAETRFKDIIANDMEMPSSRKYQR